MIDSSPLTVRLFYCFNIRGTYHPNSKYCWETLHCTSLSQFPLSGKVETPGLKLFFSRIFSAKKMASKFWPWISSIRIAFSRIIMRKLVIPSSEKWKMVLLRLSLILPTSNLRQGRDACWKALFVMMLFCYWLGICGLYFCLWPKEYHATIPTYSYLDILTCCWK